MIYIGTSGFYYQDWKGGFYPKAIASRDMLAFYAGNFSVCEINSTYYKIPSAANMAAMIAKSAGNVQFILKLHQSLTHQRNAREADIHAFREALAPLRESRTLGGVLAQFPYSFTNSLNNRGYLADLKEKFNFASNLVVEFRHHSWAKPEIPDFLKSLNLGIVNVDEPQLSGLLSATQAVTSRIGYVRFHGRNREKWFKRDIQPWERYDYLYTLEELQEWLPRLQHIAGQAETTYVFFNNHWQSQAVTNARQLAKLLDISLPQSAPRETGSQGKLL